MKRYTWTSAYVAAIEEHDRVALQSRIGTARSLMSERLSTLVTGAMTNDERDEFRSLCDCRRALDLLERVSNDGEILPPHVFRRTA